MAVNADLDVVQDSAHYSCASYTYFLSFTESFLPFFLTVMTRDGSVEPKVILCFISFHRM